MVEEGGVLNLEFRGAVQVAAAGPAGPAALQSLAALFGDAGSESGRRAALYALAASAVGETVISLTSPLHPY